MKRFNRLGSVVLTVLMTTTVFASSSQQAHQTPVGYWNQYSDKSGQLQSIIKIRREDGELKGSVVKGFPVDGHPPNHYCTSCSGKFKDKKIINIDILWGLTRDGQSQTWDGGKILDPTNGHIYTAYVKLLDQGKKLKVRGYIGISLLGRTQIWRRISKQTMQQELAKIKQEES